MRTLLFFALLAGCSSDKGTPGAVVFPGDSCDLDAEIALVAGGTKDCGHALPSDTAMVTECAMAALAAKEPMRARYDLRGLDSRPSVVFLRDSSGGFSMFTWDDDPSGGGQVGAKLERWSCTDIVVVLDAMGKPALQCQGAVRRSVVCENGKVL